MQLDSRNWIDWNLIFKGDFEPCVSRAIRRTLKQGSVAVDVGANVGTHSVEMAEACEPKGQVFAFEPNPGVRVALVENLRINGFKSAIVRPEAVGEENAKQLLRIPSPDHQTYSNQGLASLVPLSTPHHVVEVEVVTLDAFFETQGLHRLDLVKIDTQGYDAKVIRGMKRCLEKFCPVIIFEYEKWAWKEAGESLESLSCWLCARGISLYDLEQYPKSCSPLQLDTVPDHADLIATRT